VPTAGAIWHAKAWIGWAIIMAMEWLSPAPISKPLTVAILLAMLVTPGMLDRLLGRTFELAPERAVGRGHVWAFAIAAFIGVMFYFARPLFVRFEEDRTYILFACIFPGWSAVFLLNDWIVGAIEARRRSAR
jgi:hypothetical protein